MWAWIKRYLKKHYKETRPEGLTMRDYRIMTGAERPPEPRREDRPPIAQGSPKDASFLDMAAARSIRGIAENGVHFKFTFNDRQLSRWWRRLKRKLKKRG
jgi:hypothetical protein